MKTQNDNRSDDSGKLIAVMVPVLTMLFFLMERML